MKWKLKFLSQNLIGRLVDVTEQFFHLTQFLFSLPIVFSSFLFSMLLNVVIFFLFLLTTFVWFFLPFGSNLLSVRLSRSHQTSRFRSFIYFFFSLKYFFCCGTLVTKIFLWITNLSKCWSDTKNFNSPFMKRKRKKKFTNWVVTANEIMSDRITQLWMYKNIPIRFISKLIWYSATF